MLKREPSARREEIGYYYGGHKERGKKYMLYVVNSARHALAWNILEDIGRDDCVLLIADECHHYGVGENVRMFDFCSRLPGRDVDYYFALGLSATLAVPAGATPLEPFLGLEIYKYGFAEALEADIICDFSVFRVGVDFFPGESEEYDTLSEHLTRGISQLKQLCPGLGHLEGDAFFAKLQGLIRDKSQKIAALARTVLALFWRRRELVYLAQARISCAVTLIARLPETARVIVFGEQIESADTLFQMLRKQYPGQVGRYHPELGASEKKTALEQYQGGEIRILASCRALDEGLNVRRTDAGIVLSGTTTARQGIQAPGTFCATRLTEGVHGCTCFLSISFELWRMSRWRRFWSMPMY